MLIPLLVLSALTPLVQDNTPPPCTAQIAWVPDNQMTVSRVSTRPLTLLGTISSPRGWCLPASIQVSAVYFDRNDNVVCSGLAELGLSQTEHVQYTNLEIRPGNIYEFARWRNGPRAGATTWHKLPCMSPDGQTEVQPGELERATSLRLHATVLPGQNGIASAGIRMVLSP